MAVNKRLLQGAAAAGEFVPSEHFGVVLYEGDGASGHSINGGKFGAAANFNGSDSIILTGLNTGNNNLTFSAWVNITAAPSQAYGMVVSGISHYYTYLAIGQNRKVWVTNDQQISGEADGGYATEGTTVLNLNTWYHIAGTLSSTGGAKIYVNGSLDITSSSRTANAPSTNEFSGIGCWKSRSNNNLSRPFNGKIDQVRVFTSVLSASQISTLYAETVETVESLDPLSEDTTDTLQVLGDSSCVATYRFENDETDLSGNYDATGTEIQYAAGRYGQAASFNGSGSYIDIESQSLIQNDIESFSFWFKNKFVLGFYDPSSASSTDRRRWFIDNTTNGSIKIQVNNDQYNYEQTGITEDSNWHHLAVVSDGYIYLDGTALSSTFNTSYWITDGTNGTTRDTIRIGSSDYIGDADSGFSEGLMDQVRLFNKALSASEVTTLYQENSLVASYRFEGNANDDMRAYDGTASNVTYEYGLGFTPDFVWIKERTKIENHRWFDTTRGATKFLGSNNTNAEATGAATLTSFDTGGFTLGLDNEVNDTGIPYVAWCLKANGGTTSSNTDGDITSTVQANTDAGFSIVQYDGDGQNGQTVGHGLSSEPEVIIIKSRTFASHWPVYHKYNTGSSGSPETEYVRINSTNATATTSVYWGNTAPTSSVFSIGTDTDVNKSGETNIAYCFHSVEGFSKFGSYTGNAGTLIVETGFEPAFLMIKRTDAATYDWYILDNKRNHQNYSNSI